MLINCLRQLPRFGDGILSRTFFISTGIDSTLEFETSMMSAVAVKYKCFNLSSSVIYTARIPFLFQDEIIHMEV